MGSRACAMPCSGTEERGRASFGGEEPSQRAGQALALFTQRAHLLLRLVKITDACGGGAQVADAPTPRSPHTRTRLLGLHCANTEPHLLLRLTEAQLLVSVAVHDAADDVNRVRVQLCVWQQSETAIRPDTA